MRNQTSVLSSEVSCCVPFMAIHIVIRRKRCDNKTQAWCTEYYGNEMQAGFCDGKEKRKTSIKDHRARQQASSSEKCVSSSAHDPRPWYTNWKLL
jgi:hypothetical protein